MVAVAFLAASTAATLPGTTSTSTGRRTSSAASSGSFASSPFAQRYSIATLRPSTKLSSPSPRLKASMRAADRSADSAPR